MDAERRRERIGESDVFFILESISSERAEIDAFTTRRIERTSPRLLPRKLELEYRKRAFDRRLRISPTILRGRGEEGNRRKKRTRDSAGDPVQLLPMPERQFLDNMGQTSRCTIYDSSMNTYYRGPRYSTITAISEHRFNLRFFTSVSII